MFISPPRTYVFRLPRLIFFALPLFGALNPPPSQGAEPLPPTKLEMSIPPGMDDLDALQADYEKSSIELETHLAFLHKNAGNCRPNGAVIAKLLEKAAPAQANQRKKIVDSLNLSKLELQTEVAKLDGILAEMKMTGATSTMVEASKGIINKGAKKPSDVIQAEQTKIKLHNTRMDDSLAGASAALNGKTPSCNEAYDTYFKKMRPLALQIPDKLKKVEASLTSHAQALNEWAGSLGRSRTPASARNSF